MKGQNPNEYLPIAYLPGASGRSTVWTAVAELLARRREALLIDYPGLADTAQSHDIHSLADLTDWLARKLPSRCDVVAISMGSALALRLALAHPEQVRRLVLVVPCGGVNAAAFGAVDWREAFIEERPHAPRWFVADRLDLSRELGAINAPTLVVCGTQDAIAPTAIGRHLAAHLPHAKLEEIARATHDLELEHPALLASLIEAHLRR